MSDETQREHNKRLEHLIALCLMLMSRETESLQGGTISHSQWFSGIVGLLSIFHANAAALGRSAAGVGDDTATDADKIVGAAIAGSESLFLVGFRDDLAQADTRYVDDDGTLKAEAIDKRLELYADKLRATANEAFAQASDPGEVFDWILDDDAHHCQGNKGMNCPAIAEKGPYTVDTIPTWPGAGETPCMTRCRCSVKRRSDGMAPFETMRG